MIDTKKPYCNVTHQSIVRWTGAFLRERRQRVKIRDALSDWLQMPAGMPQGSHLGPLTFVILICHFDRHAAAGLFDA